MPKTGQAGTGRPLVKGWQTVWEAQPSEGGQRGQRAQGGQSGNRRDSERVKLRYGSGCQASGYKCEGWLSQDKRVLVRNKPRLNRNRQVERGYLMGINSNLFLKFHSFLQEDWEYTTDQPRLSTHEQTQTKGTRSFSRKSDIRSEDSAGVTHLQQPSHGSN